VTILIDSNNIRRLIDNLVKTAVEAMPMGGILTVVVDKKDIMLNLYKICWIEHFIRGSERDNQAVLLDQAQLDWFRVCHVSRAWADKS
jgi:hypothetical protein